MFTSVAPTWNSGQRQSQPQSRLKSLDTWSMDLQFQTPQNWNSWTKCINTCCHKQQRVQLLRLPQLSCTPSSNTAAVYTASLPDALLPSCLDQLLFPFYGKKIPSDPNRCQCGSMDGKIFSFRPAKVQDSATAEVLQAVIDTVRKHHLKERQQWHLDNSTPIDFLKVQQFPEPLSLKGYYSSSGLGRRMCVGNLHVQA